MDPIMEEALRKLGKIAKEALELKSKATDPVYSERVHLDSSRYNELMKIEKRQRELVLELETVELKIVQNPFLAQIMLSVYQTKQRLKLTLVHLKEMIDHAVETAKRCDQLAKLYQSLQSF